MAGAARPGRDQSRMSRQGRPIYLDYQATTPLAPEALRAMRPYLEELFGNPHSPHLYGREDEAAVVTARAHDASVIDVASARPLFRRGATIRAKCEQTGEIRAPRATPPRAGPGATEHACVSH